MLIRMAGAIALSCVCGIASAGIGFEPLAALAPDVLETRSLAVGDVTGDGLDDVVVLAGGSHAYYRNKIVVYAQRPDGGFTAPVVHAYGDDSGYQSKVALADLDADGRLDIVVAYESEFQGALTLLRNEGAQFAQTTILLDRASPVIEFMDVDVDGHLDIITKGGWSWPEQLQVHHGDGQGGIRDRATYQPAGNIDALWLADMDNDGRRDLVYASDGEVIVQRHENGGFSPDYRTVLHVQGYRGTVAIADFDADGRMDIATTRNGWNNANILLYPQGMDGKYRRARFIASTRDSYVLQTHDMDGDGRQDLVVPHTYFDSRVGIFLGRQGGFAPEAAFVAGPGSALAFGDLNHDGRADIAVADAGVSLLLSRGEPLEVDLGVYLGLVPSAAAVRVENHGTLASQRYTLSLRIDARHGPLSLGEMPDGCFGYTWGRTTEIQCYDLAPLAPGAHRMFAFPFALPAGSTQDTLNARAWLSSIADLRADNNVATKRLSIRPVADVRQHNGNARKPLKSAPARKPSGR